MIIQPLPLNPGDKVGIMCPAGFMTKERTDACVQQLNQWGFNAVLGQTGRALFMYGGLMGLAWAVS